MRLLDRTLGVALGVRARNLAVANGVVIALLGVLGILYIVLESPFGLFDLDGERNVPSVYAATLWFSVAVVALLLGRVDTEPGLRRMWIGLSALYVFLSADEFGQIHERLERITGIDWQILYLPIGVLASVLWLFVARRLSQIGTGFALLVGGSICIVISQVVENIEYGSGDQRVAHFNALVVLEELLELIGVLVVGLALLTALQALCRRARVGSPPPRAASQADLSA